MGSLIDWLVSPLLQAQAQTELLDMVAAAERQVAEVEAEHKAHAVAHEERLAAALAVQAVSSHQ